MTRTVRVPAGDGGAAALALAGALLRDGVDVVVHVDDGAVVDVALVGALARLRLTAARSGAVLAVEAPDRALVHLAELMGLCEALDLSY